MAGLKIPVQIDGFKCVEEMVQAVLNYTYKGKTLQEWADSISKPKTNADRIRSMSDEELAEWIERIRMWCANDGCGKTCPLKDICYSKADTPLETLDWLKQGVK